MIVTRQRCIRMHYEPFFHPSFHILSSLHRILKGRHIGTLPVLFVLDISIAVLGGRRDEIGLIGTLPFHLIRIYLRQARLSSSCCNFCSNTNPCLKTSRMLRLYL